MPILAMTPFAAPIGQLSVKFPIQVHGKNLVYTEIIYIPISGLYTGSVYKSDLMVSIPDVLYGITDLGITGVSFVL